MKYIIIGGVAGGATAAARIRRIDEFADIILIEKGAYISYANCGLPYYIGGVIAERNKLFVQTAEAFAKRFAVDVRVNQEVIKINPENQTIEIKTQQGEIYTENYDKLLLSTGAVPVVPNLQGIDNEGIFTLRNVADTDNIKNFVQTQNIKKAVVVGAGFIGLEMAENLHHLGAEVSVVEMGNQVMSPVDFSIASQVHNHLISKGVNLYLETSVEKFDRQNNGLFVHFKGGKSIEADIVILSIGVRPNTKLAVDAGLRIGETGGIWVDNFLQTSAQNIYAVGDAVEFPHPITGKPWLNYLANPANRQGRIVADNMVLGNKMAYEGAIGTAIAKVFDLTVASTGLSAKKLKSLNIDFQSSTTHSNSHAGYYPNALPMSLKLTFCPKTGKIYGMQGVGYQGVDKRIDQVALLIKKGGTIYDLMAIEHAYAPPYSSAKDPVTIAGYVANNILSGAMSVVYWRDVQNIDNQTILLDVRTPAEFEMGTIAGAKNIPLDELHERMNELPKDQKIIAFCAVGLRGYLALNILKQRGFTKVYNLSGGYKTFSSATAKISVNNHFLTDKNKNLNSNQKEENKTLTAMNETKRTIQIDACGLQCPGPILKLKEAIEKISVGEQIEITSTDAGFARDAQAWSESTGNLFISKEESGGKFKVLIEKGSGKPCDLSAEKSGSGKTFIMFSDDLDKALATFVLANGATATGKKVTIFFTFWGLNTIKKEHKPKVEKDIFGKMFSMMLPSHSLQLKLSKLNMFGLGGKMMRYIMKQKNIESLEALRNQAIEQGVEFIACQMSMDVMGIKKEELLDNVTIGGVATYMQRAEQANVNLFI